ncbi:C-type lectin mannose-binding isoform-like [Montipora foliosa]|uniref:C-type lectin mannose-binding isoform-like n=1 Tax=Montipora foliosa TaxID=591990 RepID=UPI0035F18D1C
MCIGRLFPFLCLAITMILPWHVISILCKVGWHEWNQACYKVSNKLMTFSAASAMCKQEGAQLASIHSFQENEFIRNISGNNDIYIGLSDSNIEGTFVWSDGCPLAYTNWEAGEPDNDYGLGDCVFFLGANGTWNDTPCSMWYGYVCKFTVSTCFREQDKTSMEKKQIFTSHEQKILVHHTINRRQTPSIIYCAFLCLNNPMCKSINFNPEPGKDKGKCELNDATAKDFPLHLKTSASSSYCDPNDLM